MFHELIKLWFEWVEQWGYWGVFFLMALESTIIPIPSEIIMPPAAFWASQGRMEFWGVVLAGTLGSYLGSALSYGALYYIGPQVIQRYGKYFLINQKKMNMAHKWAEQFGSFGIFLARLLPVLRHLISMPAGLLKMNFKRFSIATFTGAGLWCWVLSYWGQKILGTHPELLESPEQMSKMIRQEMMGLVLALVGIFILYAGVVFFKNKKH